jgi:transcription antitermination factor NusG
MFCLSWIGSTSGTRFSRLERSSLLNEVQVFGVAPSAIDVPRNVTRFSVQTAEQPDRCWYAAFTLPRHEKSAINHLGLRQIESFLPTYKAVHVWKNRQRASLNLPLFPGYLFVRIARQERIRVLETPGVLRIVGNQRESVPIANSVVDFLRSDPCAQTIEPYAEMVVGQKVRIKGGAFAGIEGRLVRRNRNLRFVLTIQLIDQHAAVEIDADNLEATE